MVASVFKSSRHRFYLVFVLQNALVSIFCSRVIMSAQFLGRFLQLWGLHTMPPSVFSFYCWQILAPNGLLKSRKVTLLTTEYNENYKRKRNNSFVKSYHLSYCSGVCSFLPRARAVNFCFLYDGCLSKISFSLQNVPQLLYIIFARFLAGCWISRGFLASPSLSHPLKV